MTHLDWFMTELQSELYEIAKSRDDEAMAEWLENNVTDSSYVRDEDGYAMGLRLRVSYGGVALFIDTYKQTIKGSNHLVRYETWLPDRAATMINDTWEKYWGAK